MLTITSSFISQESDDGRLSLNNPPLVPSPLSVPALNTMVDYNSTNSPN